MDESVRRAMEKWPNVPAVHGWLRLDTMGHWHLQGEPVTHAGLIDFIGRNYGRDDRGRWYFQNGPQRGYVQLDYTPWIVHVDSAGELRAHTGIRVVPADRAAVDEEGNLVIDTDAGPGLVDSGSLPVGTDWLVDAGGGPAGTEAIEALIAGDRGGGLLLRHGGRELPLERVDRADVPARFGFVTDPAPADDDDAT